MSSRLKPPSNSETSASPHASPVPPRASTDAAHDSPSATRPASGSSSDWTHTCKSCGHTHRDRYCNRCGQKARDGRLTTRRLVRDTAREVSDISRRVIPTVVHLTLRPGTLVRSYWAGQTRRWAHPLKYFFFAFAILQIAAWQTGFFDGAAQAMIDQGVLETIEAASFLRDGFTGFFGVLLPVLAGLGHIGSRYTFAEHLVFNAYTMGHLALAYTASITVRSGVDRLIGEIPVDGARLTLYVLIGFYIYAFADAMRRSDVANRPAKHFTAWVWGFVRGAGVVLLGILASIMIAGIFIGMVEAFLQ
jgi:hypothetical protein